MKLFLISDNQDTRTGMRLAGIPGIVVHEREAFKAALKSACEDKENAVIIVTEKLSREFPDLVKEMKIERSWPLLVEIPDRHGSTRDPDFITNYVREAVGIRI